MRPVGIRTGRRGDVAVQLGELDADLLGVPRTPITGPGDRP